MQCIVQKKSVYKYKKSVKTVGKMEGNVIYNHYLYPIIVHFVTIPKSELFWDEFESGTLNFISLQKGTFSLCHERNVSHRYKKLFQNMI